jgi:hypothetical protein
LARAADCATGIADPHATRSVRASSIVLSTREDPCNLLPVVATLIAFALAMISAASADATSVITEIDSDVVTVKTSRGTDAQLATALSIVNGATGIERILLSLPR